ncbi:MAG: hypothetical protein V2J19_03280 [Wenzhouxiangella sp.]|jgi:hypothetical protein|nr:hypothetical protein [Wenzhouxiangella sp.]
MTRHLAIAGTVFLLTATAIAQQRLELPTQFDETEAILGDGQPRIIVYADRAGSQQAEEWGRALESAPCPSVGVANLTAVPDIGRSMARESFSDDDPIALDWQGEVAERLGFTAGEANVYLVDGAGTALAHLHGPASEASLERLRLRAREACPAAETE